MSKLFLSYRRQDSAAYAGRLHDRLAAHFGSDQIFMDIDRIEPGEDFVEAIQASVGTAGVMLLLIGPQWTTLRDANGVRRLDDPDDFVRLEVAVALERKIRVIPVLVGGAVMPKAADLPEPLQALARRQASEISDTRFHKDVDRLIESIERSFVGAPPDALRAKPEESAVAAPAPTIDPPAPPSPGAPQPAIASAKRVPFARQAIALVSVAGIVAVVAAVVKLSGRNDIAPVGAPQQARQEPAQTTPAATPLATLRVQDTSRRTVHARRRCTRSRVASHRARRGASSSRRCR